MEQIPRISLLLKIAHHTFARRLNRNMESVGLTKAQCDVLGYLHRHQDGPVYPVDLERELQLKRPTVTGLVKRLEEKGFLCCVPSAMDRRYKELRLTEKSRAHHDQMMRFIDEQEEIMLRGLDGGDRETLRHLLTVMLHNMQE